MITIITKYYGPTNSRGSRIKATIVGCGDTIIRPIMYSERASERHYNTAKALLDKLVDYNYELIEGELPRGEHVFIVKRLVDKNDD